MPLERIYERYVDETPTTVRVADRSSIRTLDRERMYNSHLDTKGFLYTDYHDKPYEQHRASDSKTDKTPIPHSERMTKEQRAEAIRKGWETRKQRQGY